MKFRVLTVLIFLAGCATNAAQESVQSIQQFASNLTGKELRLPLPPLTANVANGDSIPAGARDPIFGYAGLKEVYAPAYEHCETDRGSLAISDRRSFSKAGPSLPIRFQCKENDKLLWELRVHYLEKNMADDKSGRSVSLVPQAQLFKASEAENRQAARGGIPNFERSTKEKAKPKIESAGKPVIGQKVQLTKGEKLNSFRRNLKAGDSVQWKTSGTPVKAVGTIVRLDGDLALVQFDNPTFTGKSVRYFNRSQLEPFDGKLPALSVPVKAQRQLRFFKRMHQTEASILLRVDVEQWTCAVRLDALSLDEGGRNAYPYGFKRILDDTISA